MSEIRSKPANKKYRANYTRIFRTKTNRPRGSIVMGSVCEPSHSDENIDWGGFKTQVCCTDDPHFGG
jgi:hypothetical protein